MHLPSSAGLQEGSVQARNAPQPADHDFEHSKRCDGPNRLTVLWLPQPSQDALPDFADLVSEAGVRPDVIVLSEASGINAMAGNVSRGTAAVVPVVDVSGQKLGGADLALAMPSRESVALALRSLQPVIDRVRALPEAFFQSNDPDLWLLGRLLTRQRGAEPTRDTASALTITFADSQVLPDLIASAERLSRTGHLERHFFDRLNTCPACSSARLLIREECQNCRSSDIMEEAVLHHLRCAYQGPERDFRDGQHLTCPKCRARLEHFSVDYDKPGILTVCNACGHSTGTGAVGFVCLDCNAKGDTSLLQSRVVNSYTLTDRGRRAVLSRNFRLGEGGELKTLECRRSVRSFVTEHRALGIACTILVIRLSTAKAQASHCTEAAITAATDLFADLLRETFTPETEILRNGLTFTVLIGGDTPATISDGLDQIRKPLEQHLSVDLDPSYEVIAPEDFEALT